MAIRTIPPLLADGGDMTIMRHVASHAYGTLTVTYPDGVDAPEDDDLNQAYGYQLRDEDTPPFGRAFIRADLDIDAENATSTVEEILDDVTGRTAGEALFQTDITRAGLGRLELGIDFNVGDLVPVRRWGRILENQLITAADDLSSPGDPFGCRVHVGGQLIREPSALAKGNRDVARQIVQERKERLSQVKAVDKKAEDAKSTAETAQGTAEDAKQIAEQSKEASDAALTGTIIEYAVGTSEESPPTSGWSTSTPQRPSGSFIWMRTRIAYGSGQSEVTSPVLVTGNTGVPGADGTDGLPGSDGLGLKTTVVSYAVHTSGTTAPTSGWASQVPPLVQGSYLWTRTIWTYTDDSTETGYSVTYLSKDGNSGDNGLPGKDGVGITDTAIVYAVSSSGTSAPTSGWVASPPAAQPGQFMWTRTTWTYSDNTTETGYSVGKIGDTGGKGEDGLPGKDGVGLDETALAYALSTSGTVAPIDGWTAAVPTLVKGRYLWTRTTWTYTDDSTEVGYSVAYAGTDGSTGEDGLPGKDGVGIKSTTITYAKSTSGTTTPTSGWGAQPPVTSPGDFVWTRTVWGYDDNTTETGYSVGKIGNTGAPGLDGEQGIPGDPGVDGRPSYTHIAYADTATGGGFSQSPQGKAYMGVYVDELPTDSSDPAKYRWSLIKGADGEKGVPGAKGFDGRTPYFHTAWADSPDGVVGFSTTDSEGKRYLGTYTDYSTTDVYMDAYMDSYGVSAEPDSTDPTRYTWVQIKGDKGDDGLPGKDGVGLADTVVEYVLSPGGTVAPSSGWSTTVPPLTKGNYLWTRTTWHYSDESTEVGHTVSYIAVDGSNGTDGLPGKDGVGITDTVISYAKSSSGTTAPTGGWSDQPPMTQPGDYVWTRTVWHYSDNTDETGFTVGKIGEIGPRGADGPQGVPGAKGNDGQTTYTWIRYADSLTGAGISNDPTGKMYIGLAHNKPTATESNVPSDYTWSLIKGQDGEKGAPGAPGHDGRTPFLHTAWADSVDGTVGFSTTDSVGKLYLGVYTDFATLDIYSDVYTDSYGTGHPSDSTDPARYSWTLIKGETGAKGDQGVPGPPGENGEPTWTWIKYSDNADGTGLYDVPRDSTRYIGIAVNKPTATESSIKTDYTWSLFRGVDGVSVAGMTIYYRLVSRDSPTPSRPTVENPSGWTTTEPDYQSGTTLYQVIKVTYSNGVFAYTDVSRVSAYMAAASAMELAEDGVARAKDINAALTGSIDGDLTAAMADSGTAIGAVADAAATARDWTVENQQDFNNTVALANAAQAKVNDVNLINWETQAERNALQAEIDEAQNVSLRLQENAIKWSSILAVRTFSTPNLSSSWTVENGPWISIYRTPGIGVSLGTTGDLGRSWLGTLTIHYVNQYGQSVIHQHDRTVVEALPDWGLTNEEASGEIRDVTVTVSPWKWRGPRQFVLPYSRGGTAFDPVATYDEVPYGPVRNPDSSYTFGFAVSADRPVRVLPSGMSTWFQYLAGARIGAGSRVLPVSYTDGPARRVVTFTEVPTE